MSTILQINVCNNVYSSGKIAGAIGDLIVKRGWESYIAYPRDYKASLSKPIRIGCWADWCLHGLEQRLFDNTGLGLGSYFPTIELIKKIEEIKPDLIHLHVLVGYYINLKVLFGYLSKLDIPIVWTLHSCWEITGHCTHFDYERCNRWKTGCYSCPLKKEYPQSYLLDRSEKNYLQKKELFNSLKNVHFVAVSKWLGQVVSESFLKGKPIEVIYNGVDLSTFAPSNNTDYLKNQYSLNNKFVAIGVASSWMPKKGIRDYFEIAERMPSDWAVIMIGLTEKQIKKLPTRVIGISKTTNANELRDFYNLADVVLNLSYEESFGLTTVEGFACGTPSIVYDRTASPELVSEETGFVVKAGDISEVIQCMSRIKNEGKASYAKKCRERAESLFDKNKNFTSYMELYDRLLNNH